MLIFHFKKLFPIVAFLLFGGITVALWQNQNSHRRELIFRHTETSAQQIRIRVEDLMNTRMASLELLAGRWVERKPPDFSQKRFLQFAKAFYTHFPGFSGINWIDPEGVIQWVFPEKENAVLKGKVVHKHSDSRYRNTFEKAGQDLECSLTPCIELYQGWLGFEAFRPLIYDGRIQGYLNGVFQVKKIMDICLAKNIFKDFCVRLYEDGQLIYINGRRGEINPKDKRLHVLQEIHFSGKTWQLELEPKTADYKSLAIRNLPFLIFGLVISAVFSFLLHLLLRRMEMYREARDNAVREVSQRKLAEEELRKTRDYLDKLIQYANAPIIVWDPDLKITRFNRAFEHLTGYRAEEVMGNELSLLFPETSRDRSLQKIVRTSRGEHWESVEIPILRKDGEVRLALWNSANVYAEDNTTLMATIAQGIDITERKRAEQEIQNLQLYNRGLIETSPDPLVTFDQKGIILDVNEATIKATGRTREELIGTLFADYFTDPEKSHKGAMLVFETGGVRDYELVMKVDGSETIVSYNASVYEDQTGQVVGAFAAARDITDQRRLEQEREVLLNELSDKNEELETFVYSVSHDLKTPIVTIEGFIGAMREDFGDQISEEQEKYIKYMSDAALKMEALINDLLEFSRIGRMTEKKSKFSFAGIVKEVLKTLQPQIKARGIEVDIQEDLPDIYGEKKRFIQVMENLLTNAVKYIGKENPCPRIDIGVQYRDSQKLFFVSDNGIGIEESYFEKIFQVFQRLPSAKRVGEGTGIGLAIVKRIIEHHGGSIWVTSKPGEGSTFFFTINDKET